MFLQFLAIVTDLPSLREVFVASLFLLIFHNKLIKRHDHWFLNISHEIFQRCEVVKNNLTQILSSCMVSVGTGKYGGVYGSLLPL